MQFNRIKRDDISMNNSNYTKRRILIDITKLEITSAIFQTYSMIGMTRKVKERLGVIHIPVIGIPIIPCKNIPIKNF